MLNITNRRGSTHQTHNETLPRVCQDGHCQTHRRQALTRRSGDSGALLGEMRHEAAAIENSVEGVPRKCSDRIYHMILHSQQYMYIKDLKTGSPKRHMHIHVNCSTAHNS